MNDRVYVTTSIPYVNARPHVGFALELVQADAIARYHRLLGTETRLQTGTDEHAFKNVLAAARAGVPTRTFVDRNAREFARLCAALEISHDDFLRTTEPRHRRGVEEFWSRLRTDDLELRSYTGLYCVACEDFYREGDVIDGRCPEHDAELAVVEEENIFFRLSRYAQRLESIVVSGELRIVPETRRREVLRFIERGLDDISVTRAASRSGGWGIRVPGHEEQVVYVWIDALINYLTGPGLGDGGDAWTTWWGSGTRTVHVIGKNVWKFHAIYWPALLLSADLPLPDEIVVHGFLTADGRKIGKSLGNAIDPFEWIDRVGPDAVRYYLLAGRSPFEDGDVTTDRLVDAHDRDLANVLGNLLSRLLALGERAGVVLRPAAVAAPPGYHDAFGRHALDEALASVWRELRTLNREIDDAEPWHLPEPEARPRVEAWLARVAGLARWLAPFLPGTADAIAERTLPGPVRRHPPLFPRARR